jgi:adenosylcobinamide-phosphate synthase
MIKLAIALMLDLMFGDRCFYRHPVILIGHAISYFEKKFYALSNKKLGGLFLLIFSLASVAFTVTVIEFVFSFNKWAEFLVSLYFMYLIPSAKTLQMLTNEVRKTLEANDMDGARKKLSYLVGRDTMALDEEGISRATVETIAENTVDGLIAPVFYIIIGQFFGYGLLFGYLYKTVNTLDSMVGYKNKKYIEFGYFSAKTDDVLNFIPARIGSLIMIVAGFLLRYDWKHALKIFMRDRKNHSSPNSAHPESVVAGLLNICLGGSSRYFGNVVEKPYIGEANRKIQPKDIDFTNNILIATDFILIGIVLVGGLIC